MKIKELFSSHQKWTKNYTARNRKGHGIRPTDKTATRFSIDGAIQKCYPNDEEQVNVFQKISDEINHGNYDECVISQFNDDSCFRTIKALVEKLNI